MPLIIVVITKIIIIIIIITEQSVKFLRLPNTHFKLRIPEFQVTNVEVK